MRLQLGCGLLRLGLGLGLELGIQRIPFYIPN